MDYYVPLQQDETCEKIILPRYTPRILGRRLALTSTAYKYLNIGISVGSTSFVEILIGDNRGNQIILAHATWTALFQKRMDIERLVQSTSPSSALPIQDLIVQLIKLRNENVVKLTLRDTCMYLKPKTVLFLFELEQCVEHIYYSLYQYTYTVSEKYKHFVSLLRQNYVNNKCDAAKLLREKYDKTSLLECEMLAYALDNIVHDALHDK
ncbi:uncharacterized protein LOC120359889 [Solenopsis invicta]|uniref:uncharacterized protein LOC113004837 n=1 Tax=Solenopsis invicta TaxID=13686 RepID=UPI000E33D6BC|nr:uncharacterized protein LOC113004837 [Solenopsis invicta]XP_039315257.1 uncharacterized protein LOC120359889 [Solenopsis invicta]